jgi:S1-C subfamily serine protease
VNIFSILGYFLLSLLTIHSSAYSLQRVSSGTGFFISRAGHIITNEHVIRGCNTVKIRGAVSPTNAVVVKRDAEIDLALLKTRAVPRSVAPIRSEYGQPVRKGERLLVIGYPEKHGISGEYYLTQSRVKALTGPMGGDRWLQFEDSARKGNSGGPLLDSSGNVIGVIMGKAEIVRKNLSNGRVETIDNSDLAINLPYLWKFLEGQGVYTLNLQSALQHGVRYLEQQASGYIVNIHCVK